MSELTLTVTTAGQGAVMAIRGDLDFHSAPRVREALADLRLAPGGRLVLDLGGLTFCDSSGISVLVAAHNHTQGLRAETVLADVPTGVSRILGVVGLERVIAQYADTRAATAGWTQAAT
ncbi:STAS domain-containing protein [Kitasatospora sp. NBC_00315]|uniref:STAS domain-containing protein n=1 Tax=Kitasatospora sp. NBC_00315 TaxID=2975963 RepID=UPI00324A7C73